MNLIFLIFALVCSVIAIFVPTTTPPARSWWCTLVACALAFFFLSLIFGSAFPIGQNASPHLHQ